jgi:hypothetical protein
VPRDRIRVIPRRAFTDELIARLHRFSNLDAPDLDYLMSSIRQAIRLARPRFEKAGIKYPEEEYLATVDRIERELKHRGLSRPRVGITFSPELFRDEGLYQLHG